jgi:Cu2+-exporting ATPase
MSDLGWQLAPSLIEPARSLEASRHTVIYLGWEGRVHALLALDDTPLAEARSMIEELQSLGLHVALLSGDLAPAARRAAAAVGIEDVQAGLSPEAKRAALDRYRQSYGVVAMVGDGLNDAPVLADADVGIAVGSATDLARETASLVLPVGGLWMLPWIITVARRVRSTILTNLAWAFGYNLIALTLAALGLLQPVLAAAIMASSSLLLVVNSLRLSRLPDPAPSATLERTPGVEPDSVRGSLGVPVMAGPAIERG